MNWMMEALQVSKNLRVSTMAKHAIKNELKPMAFLTQWNPGSFMFAVASGRLDAAWEKADTDNERAIMEYVAKAIGVDSEIDMRTHVEISMGAQRLIKTGMPIRIALEGLIKSQYSHV